MAIVHIKNTILRRALVCVVIVPAFLVVGICGSWRPSAIMDRLLDLGDGIAYAWAGK